jgi:monoamine oxidase
MNIMNFDKKEKENEKNILPIIIIGSGVSGLTIASKIKDKNFLILEARDRIGGRVFTNEKNMDMGAAWIHGSDNNPLNKYLNFDNLLPISNSNPWMHSENIPINYLSNKYNITEEKRQQLASIWNELATKIGNKHDKTIIQGLEEIKEENTDEYNKNNDLFSFLYMIEVWCGGSIKNVSTSFLNEAKYNSALFGDYGGAHYIFKNGARSLIDALINSANENNISDKIIYNQIVTKVVYNDSYVEVHTNEGRVYYCNQLCITVPPGPLKDITFCPPLDSKRMESLSRIKLGSYKKIQLEFLQEDVFWNDNNTPMFLTYNSKIDGEDYYLNKKDSYDDVLFPYILWNNYEYSKNKPILEAICPADIGWKLTGMPDETIIDIVTSHLRNYYPNMPEPCA